jgi:hypothetical protein
MGFVMYIKLEASETFVLSLTQGIGIPYAHLKCLGKTHASPHPSKQLHYNLNHN